MSNRQFRVSSLFLVASLVASVAACGPSGGSQTVSFVLDLDSERLNLIEFTVEPASGNFAGDDGSCEVGAAAGPEAASVVLKVAARAAKGKDGDALLAKAAADDTTTTTSSSSTSTTDAPVTTTLAPVTTTLGPVTTTLGPVTTTLAPVTTTMESNPTTTLAVPVTCGNGVIDSGEECDDNNTASNDGCNGNCEFEYSFSSVNSEDGELTIRLVNGKGIPPGATLAFCKFSGDIEADDFTIVTKECGLPDGGDCDPVTDVEVKVSITTTTTTTTTTTSSTTTTSTTTTTTLRSLVGVTGLGGF